MSNYKNFATNLIKRAGKISLNEFHKIKQTSWKNDQSIVTKTDVKINKLINLAISKEFPEHNIISEELKEVTNNSKYTWYVDPIDGTISFAQGFPFYCNAIGLAKDEKMILAVVYDPLHNELFVAEKGKGAYINGKRFLSHARDQIKNAYFDVCIWPEAEIKLMPVFHYLMDKMWCATKKECVILSSCYSAVGRMDGVVFSGISPWDTAIPSLIAEEAGLKVTDLWGASVEASKFTKGFIMAKPKMHSELLKLCKKELK